MKKIISPVIMFLISLFAYSQSFFPELEPEENQSVVYAGSYDWGVCVDKIVINTGRLISPQEVTAEDFEVEKIIYQKTTGIGISKGELRITDVFLSDSHGNKISQESSFITILTDVHPEAENSSPFAPSLGSQFKPFYGYSIENDELDLSIKKVTGFVNKNVSKFTTGNFSHTFFSDEEEKTINMNYASYIPQSSPDKKLPLMLWLHGISESGKNIYDVLFGTKSSELAGEKIQSYFEDGIAILAPQCPTAWLEAKDTGAFGVRYWTPVEKNAPVKKITRPLKKLMDKFFVKEDEESETNEEIPFAAVSYYTESLKDLLDTFLKDNPQIDKNRIYIGGCSAGGYMTINMLLEYPSFFAAGIPICEYYLNSKITDSQIESLSKYPLWFIYSKKDESVDPEYNSIPTIKRLKKTGAKNLHVTEFDSIIDSTGKFVMNRESETDDLDYTLLYEYEGHYSWIPFFNDECWEGETSLFQWLSRQKL